MFLQAEAPAPAAPVTVHGVVFDIFGLGPRTTSALRLSFPLMIAGWLAEP
jgi:hypothetical protein